MNKTIKILIIAPAWIGDMVMAQTLFKLLKQRTPDAILHVLAPTWTAPLLEHMPEVDHIIISPFKHGELSLYKRYRFGKGLRHENYDQAIILPNSLKSALILFWAKIPKRTGWRGEMRYGLINDMRILDKAKLPLMVQRFAALGLDKNTSVPDKLPRPQLTTSKDTSNSEQKVLVLCPGAEFGPAKRWPTEYFAQVAQRKLAENWQVILLGGNNDKAITAKIQQLTEHKCTDLAGKTTLSAAIDILAIATTVISNDTGLMHIAAALDKPLIVIYGSSSPEFTPPLTNNAKIMSLNLDCSPCFKRECPLKHLNCLRKLELEKILAAITNNS